ncbi:MAG: energy-coupling factor transporter transmembrane component T family protein [Candidatus Hodarchaeales archaeon]|jgi:energy-coupling factor transporter transmembrane protein EcfT
MILTVQFFLLIVASPIILAAITVLIIFEYLLEGEGRNMINLLWGIVPLVLLLTGLTWVFSGQEYAISVFLRIILGALSFSYFVTVTNPSDLTRVLESLKIPPRWALIPSLSLTFVPRVIKDSQETFETLTLRGEVGGRWNILTWLPRILAIMIASTIYRSEFLAQALYFRGFGLPTRTHYKKVPIRISDIFRFTYWLVFTIGLIQLK